MRDYIRGGVKITERGWPGHFICARNCVFRRNTLLEYGGRHWIVSTVGQMISSLTNKIDSIGYNRWYETMCFEAKLIDGYWDANVSKEIDINQDWGLWAESWEELVEKYPEVDNVANEMHDKIVDEMIERIKVL